MKIKREEMENISQKQSFWKMKIEETIILKNTDSNTIIILKNSNRINSISEK